MSVTHGHLVLMEISRAIFFEAEECPSVALSHYEAALEHLNCAIRRLKSLRTGKAYIEPVVTSAADAMVIP